MDYHFNLFFLGCWRCCNFYKQTKLGERFYFYFSFSFLKSRNGKTKYAVKRFVD